LTQFFDLPFSRAIHFERGLANTTQKLIGLEQFFSWLNNINVSKIKYLNLILDNFLIFRFFLKIDS
tara:strand:+ start:3991 stop:4188 length:198 start_codon:yes stop_codon:yes gene_type:complete